MKKLIAGIALLFAAVAMYVDGLFGVNADANMGGVGIILSFVLFILALGIIAWSCIDTIKKRKK